MASVTTPIEARAGITFAVDDVTPIGGPQMRIRAHEAVKKMLESDIESCSDYHEEVIEVDLEREQQLLAAVYTAFERHYPLVLTPDAVWITIAQGVAHHMAIHADRLRSRFVGHEGKLKLTFTCEGWVDGSPENPWPEAFASWSSQIREHVGVQTHDRLSCDFSTTGPTEGAVGDIVMMDIFQRYFHYFGYAACGIPTVTLEGTPDDWQRLRDKVAALDIFDMRWWLKHLLPICDQFVRASRGDVDLDHWQSICKIRSQYGGAIINGWVAKLFPYLRAFVQGPCNIRNPIFKTGEGFGTYAAPTGLSRVPFAFHNGTTGRTRRMEAIGGLIGITQDQQTLALRPKVGWAIQPAGKLDTLLERISTEHVTRDPVPFQARIDGDEKSPDLAAFYHHTNGADLFVSSQSTAIRIVTIADLQPIPWPEVPDQYPGIHRSWYRLAVLSDNSWLAVNLNRNCDDRRQRDPKTWKWDPLYKPICHCSAETIGKPGQHPVVAFTFTELLERLFDNGGSFYWLQPDFPGYGDAEVQMVPMRKRKVTGGA